MRPKSMFFYSLVLVLCIFFPVKLGALDVGFLFRFENLAFEHDRKESDHSFDGLAFPWGISVFASHEMGDDFSITAGFYQDSILRNISATMVTYRYSFISIGLGPYFGFLNSEGPLIRSGLNASLRVDFPGVIFAEIKTGSTIGGLVKDGDYTQEETSLLGGFQVMNAICTIGLLSKTFTIIQGSTQVVDSLDKYYFSTDLFQKNVPFRVLLTFAYQSISKSFITSTTTDTHTLSSLIIGTELEVELARFLNLLIMIDSSIYTFGRDDLLGVDPGSDFAGFLFSAQIGLKLNIDQLTQKPELVE
jgi:hypothetical protein